MNGEHVDAVVIGSGFGGSVAAYRLAQGGRSTVVLERGQAYPPGSFARTPYEMKRNFWEPKDSLYGLIDVRSFRKLEAVVAAGLGGGSLVYANVLLRKDERWFVHDDPVPGGGYENWPISRSELDPHYDAVEQFLAPQPSPYPQIAKSVALRDAAKALGLEVFSPPLAISFGADPNDPAPKQVLPTPEYGNLHGVTRLSCRLCGECDIGCNEGSKNTMDHTYLSAAKHHGADIRTLAKARSIVPLDGGGYEVGYVEYSQSADDSGRRTATRRKLRCDVVIVAAGALGSTDLLLRNRVHLPALGPALGTRFSGNGDLMTFLMGAQVDTDSGRSRLIDGSYGPVITSSIRVPDGVDAAGRPGRGYYIQEAGFPEFINWLIEASTMHKSMARGARLAAELLQHRLRGRNESTISAEVARMVGEGRIGSSSLPLLGMGRDVPDGVISLRRGYLDVDWHTSTSMEYFNDLRETMRQMADVLHANFHDNPLWFTQRVVTVHPLGGLPMGRHDTEGVVDSWGQAFGHPGLFVLDGSSMPGPVGPNPALTIAALADRATERMLETAFGHPARSHTPQDQRRRRGEDEFEGAGLVSDDTGLLGAGPLTDSEDQFMGYDEDDDEPGDHGGSVEFTEQMKGWVTLGATDPVKGAKRARALGHALMFELTITAPRMDNFTSEAMHQGSARGFVRSDLLGGDMDVERGWFNLFVDLGEAREMRYRLWLHDASGAPVTLYGFKTVRNDPGLDIWTDTSTLYTTLVRGHVHPDDQDGEVIGAGVLRIKPLDFARQLTTFRADGRAPLRSLWRFGKFFIGALWDVYGPGHRSRRAASSHA
ncbi:GMC oxidoreductase [Propionibacteriaceae bacterium Y1923]